MAVDNVSLIDAIANDKENAFRNSKGCCLSNSCVLLYRT